MRKYLRPYLIKLGILEYAQTKYLKYLKLKERIITFVFLPFFAKNGFLSSIYYTFFSRAFYQAHYSILNGRIKHVKNLYNEKENEYLLANYIHALEKGLTMDERRDVFALSYIEKTVKAFENVKMQDSNISSERIQWFKDILELYFNSTGDHPVIVSAKMRYERIEDKISKKTEKKLVPFKRVDTLTNKISFEEFYELNKQRRSVRWFQNKEVPHTLIDKAISAAILSPSACNRQPYRFLIFDEPGWLKKLTHIPSGTRGFHQNIPVLIALVGMTDAYENERDKNVFYIDASLAAMNFMLALETLGLSSCPLNWPDVPKQEKRIRQELDLDSTDRIVMFIAVGYAENNQFVAYSAKKSLATIRAYNSTKLFS